MIKYTVDTDHSILLKGLPVTWRTNRSDWSTTTLAPRRSSAVAVATGVDSTGRICVPWTEFRGRDFPGARKDCMSTHLRAWTTTELWDWAPLAYLQAAAVSSNGRAVAIRTMVNTRGITTAVQMRVLRPG